MASHPPDDGHIVRDDSVSNGVAGSTAGTSITGSDEIDILLKRYTGCIFSTLYIVYHQLE